MTHEGCSECSLCIHIYVLPPPDGPEVIGRCKLCGTEKTHMNSGNERDYGKAWIRRNDRDSGRTGQAPHLN